MKVFPFVDIDVPETEYIAQLTSWIVDHEWLLDSQGVDFFVNDYWSTCFPLEWQVLENESVCSMDNLLHLATFGTVLESWPESLKSFVSKCKEIPLNRTRPGFLNQVVLNGMDKQVQLGMGPKKIHEVENMAALIASICQEYKITHVLDMGSGQGYLDASLVFDHGLTVIGVDDNDVQTKGASRFANLIQKRMKKDLKAKAGTLYHFNQRVEATHTLGDILSSLKSQGTEAVFSSMDGEKLNDENVDWLLTGLHTCGEYPI